MSSTMLTVTEELWITAVSIVPTSMASMGLVREDRIWTISGISLIPDMALDIPDRPMNKTPNPRTMWHIFTIL